MILVIFDVDGTLVYSEGKRDSKCFALTYERIYQRSFPTIDWSKFPHVTDHTIFSHVIREHFQREVDEEEEVLFRSHYIEELKMQRSVSPHYFRPVPGAVEMMQELQQRERVVVGVATGGWADPARIKLEHVGIEHQTIVLEGGDGHPTRRHILQKAITRCQSSVEEFSKVVYVGDAVWDVETTREMQLDFIGVRRRHDHAVLSEIGARHVLSDYQDRDLFWENLLEAEPPGEKNG